MDINGNILNLNMYMYTGTFTKYTHTYRLKTNILLNGEILGSPFKSEAIIRTIFLKLMSVLAKAVKIKRKQLDWGEENQKGLERKVLSIPICI